MLAIALISVFFAVFWVTGRLLTRSRHPEFADVATVTQAVITVIAIFVTAYWYFVERKGEPHIDTHLSAQVVRMSDSAALIMMKVEVTNRSSRLVKIPDIDFRVMWLALQPATQQRLAGLPQAAFDAEVKGGRLPYLSDSAGARSEIDWMGIRQLADRQPRRIEPGETDAAFADIVVPCDKPLLKLSSGVRKPGRSAWQWKDRLLADLTEVCSTGWKGVLELQGKAEAKGKS